MYPESDPRVIEVLGAALSSSSRSVRLRAVCMLARISVAKRGEWLEVALCDADTAVRQAAAAVISWTLVVDEPMWPQREDPEFDRVGPLPDYDALLDSGADLRWEWEYAVEVWRGDGMLMGVFLCTTCQADVEHAKRIALGQAVLASAGPSGDQFDPATAAAFIVAKRRVQQATGSARKRREERRR